MMDDCISRQRAIDAVNAYLGLSAVSRTIQNMMSIQEILEKLPSAQHGVCRDCIMKNVCRYKTGLGDYGYCSQWRGEEHEHNN